MRRALDALPPAEKLDDTTAHGAAAAYAFAGDVDRALALLSQALRLNAWDAYYNLILPEMRPLWTREAFTRFVTSGR